MRPIKHLIVPALMASLLLATSPVLAQEFNFQGVLRTGGAVFNDRCDLRFRMFDMASAGRQVGADVNLNDIVIVDGHINADLDFGPGTLDGSDRWVEIEVRSPPGTGGYTILTPRQPITPAPYAHFALNGNSTSIWELSGGTVYYLNGSVGIGTDEPDARLHVLQTSPIHRLHAIQGEVTGPSGVGIVGLAPGGLGVGVLGTGDRYGVQGSGRVAGLFAEGIEPGSLGAYVKMGGSTGLSRGVLVENDSPTGWGGFFIGSRHTFQGNVGIGPNSPQVELDVWGTVRSSGATGGWFEARNPNNFDASVHMSWDNDVARFRVGGNGPGANGGFDFQRTGNTSIMRLLDNGSVGIGTTTPGYLLEVDGSAGKPGGGSWSNASDARLKKDVRDIDGALDTLLALRGVTFEYVDPAAINELPGERIGFIAQEVEEIIPDWIDEGPGGLKRLTVRGFEALAVEAMRELKTKNDDLRTENELLRDRLDQLEDQLEAVMRQTTETGSG